MIRRFIFLFVHFCKYLWFSSYVMQQSSYKMNVLYVDESLAWIYSFFFFLVNSLDNIKVPGDESLTVTIFCQESVVSFFKKCRLSYYHLRHIIILIDNSKNIIIRCTKYQILYLCMCKICNRILFKILKNKIKIILTIN